MPSNTRRLDRLATFTFAVGLTVAACGGATSSTDGTDDPQQTTQDDEAELRKKKDAGVKHDAGCEEHDAGASIIAMYGMPPFPQPVDEPCGAKDAGATKDAGHAKDSGGFHAMYGLPPVDPDEGSDGGGFHALYGMPPTP